jgi:hypothetical protein
MGIGSWWKRMMKREDDRAIERAEERAHETLDERRVASGDIAGLEDDEFVARNLHEGNIEDAERLAEGYDNPRSDD